jgi:hypothetical protein
MTCKKIDHPECSLSGCVGRQSRHAQIQVTTASGPKRPYHVHNDEYSGWKTRICRSRLCAYRSGNSLRHSEFLSVFSLWIRDHAQSCSSSHARSCRRIYLKNHWRLQTGSHVQYRTRADLAEKVLPENARQFFTCTSLYSHESREGRFMRVSRGIPVVIGIGTVGYLGIGNVLIRADCS